MRQESYLLRFWRTPQGIEWRITLIPIAPDAVEQHFISVEALSRHLFDAYQSADDLTQPATKADEIKRLGDSVLHDSL